MTRSIHTDILIESEPDRVWRVLTDFAQHASWDPFLTSISGELAVGRRLTVRFRSGQTIRPVVTEVAAGKSFAWRGTLGAGWVFAGRHRFELAREGNATRLVHSETFTGMLVPFFGRALATAEQGFRELNLALKHRVEAETHGAQSRDHA